MTATIESLADEPCERLTRGRCIVDSHLSVDAPYLADRYCPPCRIRWVLANDTPDGDGRHAWHTDMANVDRNGVVILSNGDETLLAHWSDFVYDGGPITREGWAQWPDDLAVALEDWNRWAIANPNERHV